ncbi:PEP-CTERM protein-sorting domain-containing protein [Marinobacter daqiaonensis]|uniref:PEP-CTERM protein-sorting domain-containing protein n=1 Tax=Marinobacter daqiaonensis TaxID=650891 RepID=A0A1I6H5U7_9GAMM|nr:DUF4381 domain-containing protein [Marinobacter daqiaonensis]SFR49661.1 PEP-CTERM protein-sorting domain-containing protein [Marinobacter daqiaonensis]
MIPPEVLDQLKDVRPPPPAPWWPPAPGWWLLAAALLLLATALAFWWLRRRRRHAPGREALARLRRYPVPVSADPEWYAGLNRLLKETALARYPHRNPASLTGAQWSHFLATTSGAPGQPWQQLVEASYRPHPALEPRQAIDMTAGWIRRQAW